MEVYVDDILIKSLQVEEHIQHLDQAFQIPGKYRMQFNPTKCVFRVVFEEFFRFMEYNWGIKANMEKIKALLDMKSPVKVKDG